MHFDHYSDDAHVILKNHTAFLCAKGCNVYSYKDAQYSRGMDRVHRDAVAFTLSWDTPSI